ncbi:MAG TPA: hypothetical protein VFL91_08240 [Thermomicrobiales bacterium]|nr:hypothetical protein [Thermomicrobiales bacterium]
MSDLDAYLTTIRDDFAAIQRAVTDLGRLDYRDTSAILGAVADLHMETANLIQTVAAAPEAAAASLAADRAAAEEERAKLDAEAKRMAETVAASIDSMIKSYILLPGCGEPFPVTGFALS